MGNPLLNRMQDLCDYCWNEIVDYLEEEELCILGHSLGAMIAYELTKRFNKMKDHRLNGKTYRLCL